MRDEDGDGDVVALREEFFHVYLIVRVRSSSTCYLSFRPKNTQTSRQARPPSLTSLTSLHQFPITKTIPNHRHITPSVPSPFAPSQHSSSSSHGVDLQAPYPFTHSRVVEGCRPVGFPRPIAVPALPLRECLDVRCSGAGSFEFECSLAGRDVVGRMS